MGKKLSINNKFKIALISISICIAITMSILLYFEYKIPSFQEEKVSLYGYNNKADIDYTISFKPNMLYDEGISAAGEIYLTSYVETINTLFRYQFSGEREGRITGNYKIIAEVEGYTGEKETYKTIWKKLFTLVPETSIEEYNKRLLIERELPLNLNTYNNFAELIKNDSKVSSQVKLTVFMDVDLDVETDKGTVKEKLSPSITIPLNTNYFEITKNIPPETPGHRRNKTSSVTCYQNLIVINSVVLGLMLILFMYLFNSGYRKIVLLKL